MLFTFVYDERVSSHFIDIQVAAQSSEYHLLMRLFPIVCSCLVCWKLPDCSRVGLFLDSLFCSIDPYVCFCANATLLFKNMYVLFIWLRQVLAVVVLVSVVAHGLP